MLSPTADAVPPGAVSHSSVYRKTGSHLAARTRNKPIDAATEPAVCDEPGVETQALSEEASALLRGLAETFIDEIVRLRNQNRMTAKQIVDHICHNDYDRPKLRIIASSAPKGVEP